MKFQKEQRLSEIECKSEYIIQERITQFEIHRLHDGILIFDTSRFDQEVFHQKFRSMRNNVLYAILVTKVTVNESIKLNNNKRCGSWLIFKVCYVCLRTLFERSCLRSTWV